ncbi:MAG TPA: glycosyltransferase family 39 protein [Candidatus Udaeobacter sp.]|nr:glycosyltransferase family 39 protein [Candidatus Udaeobacter sp.]
MTETAHLNPLPSRKERGGPAQEYLRRPQAFAAARYPFYASKVVLLLWISAVAVRLVLIDQPYVDDWSWRQSDVAAIARNFLEGGFRFGYPQIDWAANSAGYVGTEFPILPFLAAVCYKFAGIHEWMGRSQSVIIFAISLPFFFLLVREIFDGTTAIWATFFYAFAPLNIFAGRSFMPDVPSLGLGIIGLYFFLRSARDPKPASFYLSAIAISLSILIKATSVVIAAPLLYIFVGRLCQTPGVSQKRPTIFRAIAFATIVVLPSVAWYWHAHQIAERYYPHHFFGAGGVRLEGFSWYWEIAQQTATSSLTPLVAIMALIGLFVAPRGKYGCLFDWWLVAMVLFVVAVGYGNRHPWYQLPFVPIAAAFAGAACAFFGSKISSRVAALTLSILLASSFAILAAFYVRPLYESTAAQLRNAGLELNKLTANDALIVAVDGGNPTIFYYAKRKGWHFLEQRGIYGGNPKNSQQAIADLERLRRQGATHFVFTTPRFWWLESYPELTQHLNETATPLETTPEFKIYKLTSGPK